MRPPCGVVTLTTDFGIEDSYVGTMKGVGLRIFPEIRIVDITHHVAPTDVLEASLVLEDNARMRGSIEKLGLKIWKTYRTCEVPL